MHVSVLGEDKLVSTQCYFDDAVPRASTRASLTARGVHDTFNADDTVSFWERGGHCSLALRLDEQEGAIDARFVLGVVQR